MSRAVPRALAALALLALAGLSHLAHAARLVEVRTVDDEHLMVHWLDGQVDYRDDGKGPGAFMGHETGPGDVVRRFDPPLDLSAATDPATYSLVSAQDPAYRAGLRPARAFRKSKVNGTNNRWPEADYTVEHTVYLRLPRRLRQGARYTLRIGPGARSSAAQRAFTFDAYRTVSEALHVNLIGYHPDHPVKAADLYMWLGDGGARDYSRWAGRRVTLVDTKTGRRWPAGTVRFWKKSGPDFGNWNYTRSDVWTCDFSAFRRPGTYRLAVEGVGCSRPFAVRRDIYREPYRTSVRGFTFMRIGLGRDAVRPVPRQPRFIPGKDPAGFTVYLTTYGPWHPDWAKAGGDQWDNKDWSKYKEPGSPTNPNAWGGHSDACDWDRHPGHISIIWDLLLPIVLTNGKLSEDNLGIAESGNRTPDLIDEARDEVDLWLRLRDTKGAYAAGLNNPTPDLKTMYQAAARPYMAWASAANCAMLADCYRIAGKPELARRYRDAALEAWRTAAGQDLDTKHHIGNGATRGRDLKMMAAAYLYNVTGERRFEDAMAAESVVKGPTSQTDNPNNWCQTWGTAAYLMCAKYRWRPIHHPRLLANMRAAITAEARRKNVANTAAWPSRRSSDPAYGWFQTVQEVQRVCVAHAAATTSAERAEMLRALILEADWGLGRNPMNLVQMTGLGSRRVEHIYTSGRNDGTPGVHPGHTPYMNSEPWGRGYMFDPKWYAAKGHPAWEQWPHGEAFWPARYCFANNEFTPQQTMRGKMCLLAYLYAVR